jgi:hypothetical protein
MKLPIDKHYLSNMIYNLSNKKQYKEVSFTQKAVEEVLTYLKLLEEKINLDEQDEREYYHYIYNNSKPNDKENICSICGKQYKGMGNDIRPLVTANGTRCCDECNLKVVAPNRLKFWKAEAFYVIKSNQGYVDVTGVPNSAVSVLSDYIIKFFTLAEAEYHIKQNSLKDCVPVRILYREDN